MSLREQLTQHRIRTLLMGLTLFFVLAPASVLVYNIFERYLPASRQADALAIAADMSGNLNHAAAQQALERGALITALQQLIANGRPDSDLVTLAHEQQQASEAEWLLAMRQANRLIDLGWGGARLRQVLDDTLKAKQELDQLRQTVDAAILGNRPPPETKVWFDTINQVIDLGAELRRTAFVAPGSFQAAVLDDAQAAHSLWLLAEYAGRQRALLGAAIASRQAFDLETSERLWAYQGIIELQLDSLEQLISRLKSDNHRQLTPAVEAAYNHMRQTFLGDYQTLLRQLLNDGLIGRYDIGAGEWVRRATVAIDSILAVSDSMTESTSAYAYAVGERNRIFLWIGALLIIGALMGGAVTLSLMIWLMRRIQRVHTGIVAAERDNNLALRLADLSQDEMGSLAQAFNRMLGRFGDIVREVVRTAEQLGSSAGDFAASAERVSAAAEQQRSEIDQVAAAVDQMTATVQEVAGSAQTAAAAAQDAEARTAQGQALVGEAVHGFHQVAAQVAETATLIQRLDEGSQEIGTVVQTIGEIAEQTNLLALNAAIEAARAGEQGRGFAVVADEVRTLANRTQESTAQIKATIERLQQGVSQSVVAMQGSQTLVQQRQAVAEQAGQALTAIAAAVSAINDMNAQIASAVEQQGATSEEISRSMAAIKLAQDGMTTESRQVSAASRQLTELAGGLTSLVSQFRLDTGGNEQLAHVK